MNHEAELHSGARRTGGSRGIPARSARRSFRQAADDLAITPSAISQTIRSLEARVGVALFTHTTRSGGLTEASERFLERARPAFEDIVAGGDGGSGAGGTAVWPPSSRSPPGCGKKWGQYSDLIRSDDPLPHLVDVSNQGGFRYIGTKEAPRLAVLTR
jgi:hypothetical protein